MAKSQDTESFAPEPEVKTVETKVEPVEAPEAPVVETSADPEEAPVEQADVKVKLADDFEADGDVYASIPFPGDAADEDGRIKLSDSPTAYPADVAEQLAESPAVEVAE